MSELHSRKRWKSRLYSKPVFILLFILTLVTLKGAWNLHAKRAESEQNLNEVAAQFSELRNREAELSGEIARLKTDKGVEEEIRKKFSVIKDGEVMVVLVDEVATTSVEEDEDVGFFRSMWGKVKGIFGDDEGEVVIE